MARDTTVTVHVERSGDLGPIDGPVDGPDGTTAPPPGPVGPTSPPALAITGASLLALLVIAVLLLAAGCQFLRRGARVPVATGRTG